MECNKLENIFEVYLQSKDVFDLCEGVSGHYPWHNMSLRDKSWVCIGPIVPKQPSFLRIINILTFLQHFDDILTTLSNKVSLKAWKSHLILWLRQQRRLACMMKWCVCFQNWLNIWSQLSIWVKVINQWWIAKKPCLILVKNITDRLQQSIIFE